MLNSENKITRAIVLHTIADIYIALMEKETAMLQYKNAEEYENILKELVTTILDEYNKGDTLDDFD